MGRRDVSPPSLFILGDTDQKDHETSPESHHRSVKELEKALSSPDAWSPLSARDDSSKTGH